MGVYMLSYEHLCCELKRFWNSDESVPDDFTNKTEDKLVQILSGGLAGKYLLFNPLGDLQGVSHQKLNLYLLILTINMIPLYIKNATLLIS